MFTGLIADIGEVESAEGGSDGMRLRVATELAPAIQSGDSVAVSGACLTAAASDERSFEADVMSQSLSVTTLGTLGADSRVNLELALRPTDRLGGHIVQGHVDGVGAVSSLDEDGIAKRLRVSAPDDLLPMIVERGSVAVDGVSLTVTEVAGSSFEVSLIPETLARTTLGSLQKGDRVNLECDVLARYVRGLATSTEATAASEKG